MEGQSVPEKFSGRETGLLQVPSQPRQDKHLVRFVLHGHHKIWKLSEEVSCGSGKYFFFD